MKPKFLAIIVSVVVFTAVVAAFLTIGSPAKQREQNFDDKKIMDLQSIQYSIITYASQKGSVPPQLGDLNNSVTGYFVAPTDPQSGNAYEYTSTAALNFKLCAEFNLPYTYDKSPNAPRAVPLSMDDPSSQNWNHAAGHVCFDRTIDPQTLKQNQLPIKR